MFTGDKRKRWDRGGPCSRFAADGFLDLDWIGVMQTSPRRVVLLVVVVLLEMSLCAVMRNLISDISTCNASINER